MIPSATQVTGSTQNQEVEEFAQLFGALSTVSKMADESNAAESNKTFGVFLEMLKEMKASMQANSEEMHQLRERVASGEHKNKELELLLQAEKKASLELRQAEKQASDARIDALNVKITYLSMKLSELDKNFAGHYHLTTTRRIVTARYPDGNPLMYGTEVLTTGPEGVTKEKPLSCQHQ